MGIQQKIEVIKEVRALYSEIKDAKTRLDLHALVLIIIGVAQISLIIWFVFVYPQLDLTPLT